MLCRSHHLTGREREVLQKLLVSDGSVQDIADELYISRASLYRHISSMNEKTGTKDQSRPYSVLLWMA